MQTHTHFQTSACGRSTINGCVDNHCHNIMEGSAERCQASDRIPTVGAESDRKQISRLYPSLPNTERVEGVELDRPIKEKLQGDVIYRPETLLALMKSEQSTSSDSAMKAQIAILEQQKRELLSINEKWAKEYHTMVQYYRQKIRGLKALLECDHSQMEEEVCEEGEKHSALEKHLKQSKTVRDNKESTQRGNGDVSPDLLKAEQEAEQLRAQNSTLTRRGQHQHEEIARLNKALEEALQVSSLENSSETQEEVWKHQAEVYKEDFLKERRDREKLKEKHLELEKRFRKTHAELHRVKSQVNWTPSSPKPAPECTCTHRANQTLRESNTPQRSSPNIQHCCQLQQSKPR